MPNQNQPSESSTEEIWANQSTPPGESILAMRLEDPESCKQPLSRGSFFRAFESLAANCASAGFGAILCCYKKGQHHDNWFHIDKAQSPINTKEAKVTGTCSFHRTIFTSKLPATSSKDSASQKTLALQRATKSIPKKLSVIVMVGVPPAGLKRMWNPLRTTATQSIQVPELLTYFTSNDISELKGMRWLGTEKENYTSMSSLPCVHLDQYEIIN